MFSAMMCYVVNGYILCAQPVSTRYEVIISKSTAYVMEGIKYHFVPSLSDKDITKAVMGDQSKLNDMNGCQVTVGKKEYYHELPCSTLKKIIKCGD